MGKGLKYKDIKLPCGGSIELIIVPNPNKETVGKAIEALGSRKEFLLKFDEYEHKYRPKLQINLYGRDEAIVRL